MEDGTNPNLGGTETPYKWGYATLIVAGAQRVQSELSKHLDVLKYLISRGLPVDVVDIVGYSALAHTIVNQSAKLDLARVLLEAGADVNHQDRYGEVALLSACQRNYTAAIDLFCEFGADLEIADADGVAPISFSLRCGPQVTATVQKWVNKRNGTEAPRTEKRCDNCGKTDVALKNCSRCQVARYCNVECQRMFSPTTCFYCVNPSICR